MIEIGLRAPEPEDLEIMLAVENDPGLWEHSSENTGPYTRFQMKQYIAGNTNDIFTDRQLRLMITLTDGRIAGIVDWRNIVSISLALTSCIRMSDVTICPGAIFSAHVALQRRLC